MSDDDEGYDADPIGDSSEPKIWISSKDVIVLERISWGENSDINSGLYKDWKVALKIVPGSTHGDDDRRERFNRQVKILNRARHKNIVKFIGATVDDDSRMIIVLEMIPYCTTLEEYIIEVIRPGHEVMTLDFALSMGIAITEAMDFVHSQRIMHHNLKLSNILTKDEISLPILKLTGFSNAREAIFDEVEDDIEPVFEGFPMRAIAKTQYKQKDGYRLDMDCFGQLFHKILKEVTRTDPKERINSTGHLYLSSYEDEYHDMEDIPEELAQILIYCFKGQASFQMINKRLHTIFEHTPDEEHSYELPTPPNSVPSSGGLEDNLVIDPRGILQGECIATTTSATFYESIYQGRHVLVQVFLRDERNHGLMARKLEFDRKVGLLLRLKHPNIVQFTGSCMEPSLMIATEFMEGGTLEKYLQDLGTDIPPIRTALNFAWGISKAMLHLHSNGIIHCDLKSSNVFLSKDADFVKLGGFGNAKKEADYIRDMFMGSKASTSSEIRQNKDGRKTDVFDFSRILFELLTNRPDEFDDYVSPSEDIKPSLDNVAFDELVRVLESCSSENEEDRIDFDQISNMLKDLLRRNPHEVRQDEWALVREFLLNHRKKEDETNTADELERVGMMLKSKEERKEEKKKKALKEFLTWFNSLKE